MFSKADKTVKPSVSVQRKAEQAFFGPQKAEKTAMSEPSFFQPAIQPKLKVNRPNDAYEKEADLVAERVVNMPEPNIGLQPTTPPEIQREEKDEEQEKADIQMASMSIQRMTDEEQEENTAIQAKQISFIQRDENTMEAGASGEEEENIQTFSNQRSLAMHSSDVIQLSGRGPPATGPQFQSQLHNSTSDGRPMSEPVGNFMESRFGADFSSVRIHTDTTAQQMSKQINAHAFTYGNHIYFNSGKYDPESSAGKTLLAHELTHTIQQGASPVHSNVQRKHNFTAVQRKTILQRQVAPQLSKAVELAEAEQGKVIANKEGPDGYRVGWERLMEYFTTTFGKDKIVSQPNGTSGVVWKEHIKKQSKVDGMIPNQPDTNKKEKRDAMPSWCGIFAFWALNKAGVPMPKWKLGEAFIPPEAAYPPGYTPKPGDLAFKQKRSHYGLVVGMEGPNRVKSVNGNTAGDDNLGGEVQVQTHDISNWHTFFNPLVVKTGSLRDPKHGDEDTEPKTFRELRKLKYNVSRKAENENEEEHVQLKEEEEESLQRKMEAGSKTDEEEMVQAKEEEEEHIQKKEEEEETLQAKEEEEEALQRKAKGDSKTDEEEMVQAKEEEENIQRSEIGNAGGFASNGVEYEDGPADIQTKTQSSLATQVSHRSPGNMIQGGWLGDAWNAVSGLASDVADLIEEGLDAAKNWLLDKVRDFVVEIPGYTLLSYILGYDPITGRDVKKTPITLLNAVLDIIPIGGDMVKWVLDYFQATNPVAQWLFTSVGRFMSLISSVESRFERFWNRLSIDDVSDPEAVMNDVAGLFRSIVTDIVSFVGEVGGEFLTMVKEIAINVLVTFVQNHFPDAFDLLTVLLGENPITKKPVARNGTNILNAGLKVLGDRGAQIKRQMTENGIFQKCVMWIDRSIHLVLSLISDVGNIFNVIWEAISFESLFHPIDTFTRIAGAFTTPIARITSFLTDAMIQLLAILREALLDRLSRFARETRGYFLITVLIGRDPFTGNIVQRNTENIIHGFFSLMEGGEEQFQQMKESGAIDRMSQKISTAVKRLNFTLEYVLGLFTSMWESLDWNDFLNPLGVFRRIVNTFGDPVIRLVNFVITIVKIAIEILLVVMNFPTETLRNIIQKSMEVFETIKRDPIGFLKNLLRGIKKGFTQFFDNILTHLMNGLASWLFGSLGDLGIERPPDLSFRSILNLILQVLNISVERIMERVWLKLTEQIGAEKVAKIRRAVDRLTGIWSFIKDVIERGPIAIWEFIQEKLSDLWNMVLDAAKNWIMTRIIGAVTTKILSMLDPTGIMAVINSVIAVYRAIQTFIEKLREMLEIVNAFVNGVAEVASGNIQVAADYLERSLARGVPVMIGFLANQVGLGGIGRRIAEVIGRIRAKITEGIDWLIAKALRIGRPIIDGVIRAIEFGERMVERGRSAVRGAVDRVVQWWRKRKRFRCADGRSHSLFFRGSEDNAELTVASTPTPIVQFLTEARQGADRNKRRSIDRALGITREINQVKGRLKRATRPDTKTRLNQELDTKMASLVSIISRLMGGNAQSLRLLEVHLGQKITRRDGNILVRFKNDINSDKNKADGRKVYKITETTQNGVTSVRLGRNPNMAQAGYMSIYINDEGILTPGNERTYVPAHRNYIPDRVNVTERNGIYTANYTTKTYDGRPGPTFKIDVSFAEARGRNPDRTQQRVVRGRNMVFKPEGNPRGVTDSAGGGFDNAHLIGDRFGGSGKNSALNIYPSSPNYNRRVMLGVEDRMARIFSGKTNFDLTVTARIKEERDGSSSLQQLLESEFRKDNPRSTRADDPVKRELKSRLQTAINRDLRELPGQFLSVRYQSRGNISTSIGADSDYSKSVREFERANVNS